MKRTIGILAAVITLGANAQDFHYTHFYAAPYTMNPAMTGAFTGDIRAINNYRSQWGSITSHPYKSETFSVDGAVLRGKMQGNSYFSAGFSFNNDKAGLSKMTTNLYNVAASYTQALSGKITNDITVGFMTGYGMRSIDFSELSWDNQYGSNGYDPTLPSGEAYGGGLKKTYLDLSAGLLWSFNPTNMFKMKFGVGALHLNTPNVGFMGTDKLYSKYVIHGLWDVKLGSTSNVSILPAFEVALQGPTTLINVGTNFKYVIQDRSKYTGVYSEVAISLGGWCRVGDAGMFTCRLDYGQFALGVSYDANISELTAASNGKGGFELLFVYTGVFKNGTTIKVNKSRI